MQTPDNRAQEISIRSARLEDAPWISRLVAETSVLDVNSCYLYLLLCRDFSETCFIAEHNSEVVGFVTAYRPPQRLDVLFVWQVGVSAPARRRGLGLRLLTELLERQTSSSVRWIEATVAPSNTASRRLFDALAARLAVPLNEADGFTEANFGSGNHEAERLIQIGPLP